MLLQPLFLFCYNQILKCFIKYIAYLNLTHLKVFNAIWVYQVNIDFKDIDFFDRVLCR